MFFNCKLFLKWSKFLCNLTAWVRIETTCNETTLYPGETNGFRIFNWLNIRPMPLNVVEICHFRVNWNDILQYNWQYFRIHEANNFGNTIFIIFTHFMTDIYQVSVERDNLAPNYRSKLKAAILNKKQLSFTTYKPGWIFGRIRALKMLWSPRLFDRLTFQFLPFFFFCLFVCLFVLLCFDTSCFFRQLFIRARSSSYSRGTSY